MKQKDKGAFLAPMIVPVMLLLLLLSDSLELTNGKSATDILIRIIVLQIIVFVMPALFYAGARRIKYVKQTKLRPFAPSRIALIITLLVAMMTGSFLLNIAVQALMEGGQNIGQTVQIYGAVSEEGGIWLTVLAVCIAPAVCEEFAFRGVLLSELRTCRALPACLATALLFAAVHLDLFSFASNVFCGLVLGWLVIVTRSLIASMVLHALYNISLVFILPYVWKVTLGPMGMLLTVFVLAGIFILCVALALGEAQAIYNEYALEIPPEKDELPKSTISVTAGFVKIAKSPAMWISFALFALTVLLS